MNQLSKGRIAFIALLAGSVTGALLNFYNVIYLISVSLPIAVSAGAYLGLTRN